MAKTINEAFRQYASNLNITDRQATLVANCKNNVVARISAELSLHQEKSRVIGSWDRDTLTRYLSEGDVDVMVILHYGENKVWDNAEGTSAALNRFKKILDKTYPQTPCRVDENCVTMRLKEFRLDVVPAFSLNTGGYSIPDTTAGRWIKTDPIKFADGVTAINKQMDGYFVPLVKMVKGWNREVGCPIKSFHLECMMYRRYMDYTKGYTYNSMLRVFLQALPGYLENPCYDPVTGERVDEYLGSSFLSKRNLAIAHAKAAAAAAPSDDREERYPSTAIKEWKVLLGEFFPAYG